MIEIIQMMRRIPFLLAVLLPLPALAQTSPFEVEQAYKKYCSVCHGLKGDAKTSAGSGMRPPPRDFSEPQSLVDLTRERMITSIAKGRPGTAMVGWEATFTDEQVEALADYIRNRLMLSSRAQDASLGRRLFATNCSVCHGDKGNTAIWARSGLTPQPRNFTTDLARQELSRERMLFSVTYGRPESAMPAWGGRLKAEEIEAVVDYIREAFLFPPGTPEPPPAGQAATAGQAVGAPTQHQHDHYDLADMSAPMPRGLTGDAGWGERFFNDNCATCHGKEGDGQGPRAYFINPKPRNFTHPAAQHKYNRQHLYEVISAGVRASEMPAWRAVMGEQEIANVAEYVFQRFILPGVDPNAKPFQSSGPGADHSGH